MTREFNKPGRDDSRPSFRDRSSNNHGDERAPRPARPRLNRETVDRAWESGGQRTHADYRPRSTNGQPPRKNWHNQSPAEYSSSQNGHGGNRPYNSNRQEQYRDNPRRFERTSNDTYGPRSRPSEAGRREYEDQRFGERRSYGERPGSNGARPARPPYRDNRDNNQPRGRGGPFQGRDQDRDHRRRDFDRDERGGRPFERNRRPFEAEQRGGRGLQEQRPGPDTQNPRWQTRPWAQRDNQPHGRQEGPYRSRNGERFEGDYERFERRNETPNRRESSRRPDRPEGRAPHARPPYRSEGQEQAEERHVTRLPDGRVLKGPRPVQRKEAEFWTGIAEDTEGLVSQVRVPESESVDTEQAGVDVELPTEESEVTAAASSVEDKAETPRKPRTRSASATVRGKKAASTKESKGGLRPSQRGYKWPTT
jgi:hypothetical protein